MSIQWHYNDIMSTYTCDSTYNYVEIALLWRHNEFIMSAKLCLCRHNVVLKQIHAHVIVIFFRHCWAGVLGHKSTEAIASCVTCWIWPWL